METPRNSKQIYFNMGFLLTAHPRKLALYCFLLSDFEETGFPRWSLSSGCNFQSCILAIHPNNLRKSSTVPIWQISLLTIVLFQWGGFSFLLKCCPYFRDSTQNNSAVFVTLVPATQAPIIWPLLKSDGSAISMNFDKLLLMISVQNNNFS